MLLLLRAQITFLDLERFLGVPSLELLVQNVEVALLLWLHPSLNVVPPVGLLLLNLEESLLLYELLVLLLLVKLLIVLRLVVLLVVILS